MDPCLVGEVMIGSDSSGVPWRLRVIRLEFEQARWPDRPRPTGLGSRHLLGTRFPLEVCCAEAVDAVTAGRRREMIYGQEKENSVVSSITDNCYRFVNLELLDSDASSSGAYSCG